MATFFIAQGVANAFVSSISQLTIGTCKMIGSVCRSTNPYLSDVKNLLVRFDIERRVNLIDSIVETVEPPDTKSKPIHISVEAIREVLQRLHNLLELIYKRVEEHEQRWFSNWLTLNLSAELEQLKFLNDLLEKRFDDLVKVASLRSL